MVTTPLSGLEPKLASLLTRMSFFESRVHCWFAAVTAASLAGAMPPLEVRDDSVKVSGPAARGSVTCASPPVHPSCNPANMPLGPEPIPDRRVLSSVQPRAASGDNEAINAGKLIT